MFTEQGVAMLSSVLRSKRAVAVNIAIIERETHAKLGRHDQQLDTIFKALRQLISPPPAPKHRVGFAPPEDKLESAQRRGRVEA